MMAFIPLFVAIDVPGLVPIFISLTEGMTLKARRKLIVEASLTSAAVALVFLILVWLAFRHSDLVIKLMGEGGSKAFAKVAALFLVAIAVMMIRVGVQNILK